MKKKILIGIRAAVLLIMAVLFVMHPRVNGVMLILVSAIFLLVIIKRMKPQNYDENMPNSEYAKKVLSELIVLGVVYVFGGFFNLFCPYHAPYEYKGEIHTLKTESNRYYRQFPDSIPKNAEDVKWYVLPSVLQGSGYECLFFRADREYLEAEKERFAVDGDEMRYNGSHWVYTSTPKNKAKDSSAPRYDAISIPGKNFIPAGDEHNTVVYMFDDNDNWNHPSLSGVYINVEDGFIGYFCE